MYLIGLTGGIATGKSTVAKIFSDLGVPVVDSDIIAREVVEPGKRAWSRIRETFGESVFHEDGSLDRAALGKLIFENATKRHQLNRITHPEIFRAMCWKIIRLFFGGHQFVILDLPLLYESGMWEKYVKSIIVVSCSDNLQLERLMQRNELTSEAARVRIDSQMSLSEKRSKADYIIENSGTTDETKEQVLWIYDELRMSNFHVKMRVLLITAVILLTGSVTLLIRKIL